MPICAGFNAKNIFLTYSMISFAKFTLVTTLWLTPIVVFSQVINNTCVSATLVPIGTDATCPAALSGTTKGATPDPTPPICGDQYNDVWYRFVASQAAHLIQVLDVLNSFQPNTAIFSIEIYAGTCANHRLLYCLNDRRESAQLRLGDLIPGDTYYIRILGRDPIDFKLCVSELSQPIPSNDACAQATTLLVNPSENCDNFTVGNTKNATLSSAAVCGSCPLEPDVWYTFTATHTNHEVVLNGIKFIQQNQYTSAHVTVFKGVCGQLESINRSNNIVDAGTLLLNNLVVGQSYYIQVGYLYSEANPIQFSICVTTPTPPANDHCSGAKILTPSDALNCNTSEYGTLRGATSSRTDCQGAVPDVWYKFTTTSVAHRIVLTPYYETSGFEVYRNDCDQLVSVACAFSAQPALTMDELTIGTTYYLRIFSSTYINPSFAVCILTLPPPPVQDVCTGALPLSVNADLSCNKTTDGSTLGATSSAPECGGQSETHDVWHTFVATSSSHILTCTIAENTFGRAEHFGYEVLGGSCGSLSSLVCKRGEDTRTVLQNLTVGATYWIRVYSLEQTAHRFSICVKTVPPPPANDVCSGAHPLTVHGDMNCLFPTAGNTAGSTAATSAVCFEKNDVWYRFKAVQTTQQVDFENIGAVEPEFHDFKLMVELLTEDCGNLQHVACWEEVTFDKKTLYLAELEPGKNYYLRVANPDNTPMHFSICAKTPPPPPTNDRCKDAVTLPALPSETFNWVVGTTLNASPTPGALPLLCCERGDVWYQFTATNANHDIQLQNISGGFFNQATVNLYASGCGNFQLLAEGYVHYSGAIHASNLTPGATYWLRIHPRYDRYLNFEICVNTPKAAVNDDCDKALPFSISPDLGCTPLKINTYAATPSKLDCDGKAKSDLWYVFTAESTIYRFYVSETYPTSTYDRGMEILSGGCTQFVTLSCNKFPPQRRYFEQRGFEIGKTYYVRFWSDDYLPVNWETCAAALPTAPNNDACANTVPLVAAPSLPCEASVNGTTLSATASKPDCNNKTVRDVWYAFTAESEANLLQINNVNSLFGGENALGFEIIAGDCTNGNSLICQKTGSETYWILQLEKGKPYRLRVFSDDLEAHQFNVCLAALPKPVNDDCAQAIAATVNPDLNCNITHVGSTAGASSSGTSKELDIWYTFTALNTTQIISFQNIKWLYGYEVPTFQVYEGNACDNGALVGTYNTGNQQRLEGLKIGQLYTLRVFNETANIAASFDLCILTPPNTPTNTNCSTAIPITVNPTLVCDNAIKGSTAGLTGRQDYGTCYPSTQLYTVYELWYTFTAITPNHVVKANNVKAITGFGSGAFAVSVLSSDNCQQFSVIKCNVFENSQIISGLTPGKTYYVVVNSGLPDIRHEFDLCVTTYPVPENDLCEKAIELPVSTGVECTSNITGLTLSATQSQNTPTCVEIGNDVWYKFTAERSEHTIQVSQAYSIVSGGLYRMAIYSGGCGQFKSLYCGFQLPTNHTIILGDLIPGEQYWIRIGEPGGDIRFDICVSTPPSGPANDICTNAISLPVSAGQTCASPVVGTTRDATPSVPLPNAYYHQQYRPYHDVWYKFVATQAHHAVLLTKYPFDTEASVYSGNCGAQTLVKGVRLYEAKDELKLFDLTPGETYYVRVASHPLVLGDFEICILTLPAPSNDDCANAIALEENTDLQCTQETYMPLGWATQSAPDCKGEKAHDIWFKWVATATTYRLDIRTPGTNSSQTPYGLEVLEGTCGTLTVVQPCLEQKQEYTTVRGLTTGKTYYVRLYSTLLESVKFGICLRQLPDPPANDDCAQSIELQVNGTSICNPVNGTTLSSGTSDETCSTDKTIDVWYRFKASGTKQVVDISLTNFVFNSTNVGMALYSGTGCSNMTLVKCFDNATFQPQQLEDLTVGATYFIRVFNPEREAANFSICLREIPTNTVCGAALLVTPSPNMTCSQPISGNMKGLTERSYASCFPWPNSINTTALWYRFIATNSWHVIRLQNVVSESGSPSLKIALIGSCNNQFVLGCSDENGTILAGDLTPGQEYLIQAGAYLNTDESFELCVLTPEQPVNDNCPGVVKLDVSPKQPCSSPVSGTTLMATNSLNAFNCKSGPDVIYSFVATAPRILVNLSNVQPQINGDEGFIEVLEGPCGNWTKKIGCYAFVNEITLTDLEPGTTYFLRIGTIWPKYVNFDLCLSLPPYNLSAQNIVSSNYGCKPGAKETITAYFYNAGHGTIPANTMQFTLTVSGANNGTYGPIIYPDPLDAFSHGNVIFADVDLSKQGDNLLIINAVVPDDLNPDDNTRDLSVTPQPYIDYFRDADGDGYGDAAVSINDCQPPAGYVANNLDCDDTTAEIAPGRPEVCDGLDNDCDGLEDAADPKLINPPAPDIQCPTDLTVNSVGNACVAYLKYTVKTTDYCGFNLAQTAGLASGAMFPVGTTVNQYVATAPNGDTAGCAFSVTVQKNATPERQYGYTLIGFNEVFLQKNTVQSGGVGVANAGRKAILRSGTRIVEDQTFVKSPILDLDANSQVATKYPGQVNPDLLPVFKSNQTPTHNDVVIPNSAVPDTLALGSYGNVTVDANATVVFAGKSQVRMSALVLGEGAKMVFMQNTELLVNGSFDIGQNASINAENAWYVQFFVEGTANIKAGAQVWANIYSQQNLALTQASATQPTQMTGQFIAATIQAQDHVVWNWDAARCTLSGSNFIFKQSDDGPGQTPSQRIALSPNPATTEIMVEFELETPDDLTMQILDVTGRPVRSQNIAGERGTVRYRWALVEIPNGFYYLHVISKQGKLLGVQKFAKQ